MVQSGTNSALSNSQKSIFFKYLIYFLSISYLFFIFSFFSFPFLPFLFVKFKLFTPTSIDFIGSCKPTFGPPPGPVLSLYPISVNFHCNLFYSMFSSKFLVTMHKGYLVVSTTISHTSCTDL
jgi:hypothetical protein